MVALGKMKAETRSKEIKEYLLCQQLTSLYCQVYNNIIQNKTNLYLSITIVVAKILSIGHSA